MQNKNNGNCFSKLLSKTKYYNIHMFRIFLIFAFVFYIAATIARANDTALPTGQEVISGSANFNESNNQLTINQSTEQLITNWNSFNIGRDATVEFVQPNTTSSALNRVNASDPTYIYGQLKANGQVVLINSKGVIFQNGSQVDVGSIIASSLDMDNGMFLDNKFVFENKDHDYDGVVNNKGEINAFQNGHIAFIAPEVTNEGIVKVASGGSVSMLAGDKVTMHFNGNKLINYSVDKGTVNALVENHNAIEVIDGIVILSAQGVSQIESAVVNNSGIIKADSMTSVGGKVFLSSSNQVANSGTISTNSYADQGGHIQVTANDIYIQAGSVLEAKGTGDGGKILIGGSWQNSDPSVQQAITTNVESGTIINASSTYSGDGGEVVVWSDINDANSITRANGTIYAKGGTLDGNGGRVETSGGKVSVNNISVNTTAENGFAGIWLLDPPGGNGGGGGGSSGGGGSTPTTTYSVVKNVSSLADGTYILDSTINSNLLTTNFEVLTPSDYTNIEFKQADINYSGDANRTLTFKSAAGITGSYDINKTGTGLLNVVMWSDSNGDGTGAVELSNINTNGGNLWVGGGSGTTTWNGLDVGSAVAQKIKFVTPTGNTTAINTGVGNIKISASASETETTAVNTQLITTTGNIDFNSNININSADSSITFNTNGNAILSSVISGSGSLTKSGSGTLTLTGNNTYSGGTTINAGTAKAGAGSFGTLTKTTRSVTSGSFGTGNIEISAGTLDVNNYLIYNTKTGIISNIINKPNPTLTFSNLTIAANGMSNDPSNALTDVSNGALSFAQTDTNIVNLNSTTGITSLVGNNGNSTITASTLETNEYNAAQSSYMLSYVGRSLTGSVASSSLGSNSVSSHIMNAGLSTSANQAITQLSIIDTISNNVQGSAPTTTNSSSATDQNASLNTLDNKTIKVEASKDNEEENKVVPLNVKVDEQNVPKISDNQA